MSFSHKFLVPDYYPDFACKGGECRATCCNGWGISVSMNEYFHLIGMDCPGDLRKRLDCAFYPPKDASSDRFRLITPKWNGDCPLRAEDGLCALQCACGEDVLPAICRYYPRGARREFAYECSCSNSCEKVLETLFDREPPLTFQSTDLTFDFDIPTGNSLRHPRGYYNAIRKMCGDLLQKRNFPLPDRLMRIGRALAAITPLMDGDAGRMAGMLVRHSLCADALIFDVPTDALPPALHAMRALADAFAQSSSLEKYCTAARQGLGGENGGIEEYKCAAQHFEHAFPNWRLDFEQMLVNHLFYECFPFSDIHQSLDDEALALCALYALVRYLVVGYMADKQSRDDYVDVAAAAFRLIEHSRFDHNAAVVLHKMHYTTPQKLAALVSL